MWTESLILVFLYFLSFFQSTIYMIENKISINQSNSEMLFTLSDNLLEWGVYPLFLDIFLMKVVRNVQKRVKKAVEFLKISSPLILKVVNPTGILRSSSSWAFAFSSLSFTLWPDCLLCFILPLFVRKPIVNVWLKATLLKRLFRCRQLKQGI